MTRDTLDMFKHGERERGRFGDGESESTREKESVCLALVFRDERPLSIAVSHPSSRVWKWLPKSKLIEVERTSPTTVNVTMPVWLAKDKELV